VYRVSFIHDDPFATVVDSLSYNGQPETIVDNIIYAGVFGRRRFISFCSAQYNKLPNTQTKEIKTKFYS
jgi:hypothetical protein